MGQTKSTLTSISFQSEAIRPSDEFSLRSTDTIQLTLGKTAFEAILFGVQGAIPPPATLTHDPLAATKATAVSPTHQASLAEERFALALSRVVLLLMRCPAYQTMTLREIEQRVMPPLLHGQYAIMDATVAGRKVTAAAAFWAFVSPDVDACLSDPTNPQKALRVVAKFAA